jgi:hypothetical protein
MLQVSKLAMIHAESGYHTKNMISDSRLVKIERYLRHSFRKFEVDFSLEADRFLDAAPFFLKHSQAICSSLLFETAQGNEIRLKQTEVEYRTVWVRL